jgi:aryl carrier-like protein
VFRYWSDHISDEQANEMAASMATVLNSFLDSPAQSVGDYDEERGRKPTSSTPGALRIRTSQNGVTGTDSTDSTPTCEGSPADLANTWSKSLMADSYEATLLSLWSATLHLPQHSIGASDSFFEVGGDSITAMKLVSDARDRGMALTVADVFQHPIFEDMAASVRASEMDDSKESSKDTPVALSQYERFSLLAASNVDAFLQTSIVPQVCVFRGGLADVLPATDFQSLAVSGALLESQFMLNYFFLDGEGPLNLVRLRRACMQLVQDLDILRTVFVPSGGRFLQVVLRTLRPAFDTVDLDHESIEDHTAGLQQRAETRPRLGESFVAFTVIRHRPSGRHRLLLRLSHAQYDGVCLPKILEALQAAYQGEAIQSPPSFANYLRASAGELTSGHYQHWTELLKGSSMTEIVRRNGPSYRVAAAGRRTAHLQRTVHLPPVDHGHITAATVIKAAWSYVLARLTANPDVVFGHTISGRNATVDGVANLLGPCVNLLPVRVRFTDDAGGPTTTTARQLFDQVQGQQVDNMAHEVLGFRDIVRHCTSWPNWTYFTSAVQHQNLDPNEAVRIGDVDYKVGYASATDQGDWSDINVVSQPSRHATTTSSSNGDDSTNNNNANMYETTLSFVEGGAIPRDFADRALDLLCESAASFAANPDSTLPTTAELCSSSEFPEVPFKDVDVDVVHQTTDAENNSFESSRLQSLNPAQRLELSALVTAAWRQVLSSSASPPDEEEDFGLDTSFFDLGGDIVDLAQLAWVFDREGGWSSSLSSVPPLRLDDLVAHPTLRGHMALLAASFGGGGGGGATDNRVGGLVVTATVPPPSTKAATDMQLSKLKRTNSPLRRARQLARIFRRKKGNKTSVTVSVPTAA